MGKILNRIIILTISLLLLLSANIIAEDLDRQPRLNFNGITGDDFIGQAGVLYPFRNTEDSLWFTDFRYRISEDDVDEWNLGLGYRKKIDTAENHIAGIYAYKDRREEYDHYWDMWTVGGEILTDQWDFRLNGYITDDDKVLAPGSTAGSATLNVRPEDQVLVYSSGNEIYYKSMNGLDIEIGKRFTETDTIFKNVGVYAKLFRFFESDTPTITGRQIRIDKQFGNRNKTTWKIGAQWRDDNVRGSETEATFAVSIPFGEGKTVETEKDLSSEDIVEARMTEKPERDLDVVVGESVSEESSSVEEIPVENPAEGVENIQVLYVTKTGSEKPDGSKDNPYSIDELTDYGEIVGKKTPRNFANDGDIIVLSGIDGNIDLAIGDDTGTLQLPIILNPYQQFVSSNKDGHALVTNPLTDEKVKFEPDVKEVTIEYTSGNNIPALILTENNIVSGIELNINSSIGAAIASDSSIGPSGIADSAEDYMNINNNIINFTSDTPISVTGIDLTGHDEMLIDDNELTVENEIKEEYNEFGLVAEGIVINDPEIDMEITITDNTIEGFYISGDEKGDFIRFSSIFIQDFSNDYTTKTDFDNIVISGNTIKNTDYGIGFFLNYDSYLELEKILDKNQLNSLILDNKYEDNNFEINDLIIDGEEINKDDREVIILMPVG